MRVKLYRAPRMAAAMAQIRAELGPEALILATRPVAEGVEVTAAIEPAEPLAPPRPDPARAAALAWHGVPEALRPALGAGPLEAALAATLRFAELPLDPGVPLLLVGPPGGGKTLTVARLATRLVLAGVVPRVFTADGQRAGAVEQLAAFTRLLGLDLVAAGSAAALARALARGGTGPVLIDTPGLDPFAPDQRAGLAALMEVAGGSSALVLPAGLDPAEAAELAGAYRAAGARLLIATRLDLARRLGGVLAAGGDLALAEAGVGPGAADGLAPLTPALLAARLRPPATAPDRRPGPEPDASLRPPLPPAAARTPPVWPTAPAAAGLPPGPRA